MSQEVKTYTSDMGITHVKHSVQGAVDTDHTHIVTLGHGLFEIMTADLECNNAAPMATPCECYSVSQVEETDNVHHYLFAGFIAYRTPVIMQGARLIEGPAKIYCTVHAVEAGIYSLNLQYRRIRFVDH